ncbi:hypothetical protein D3C72_1607130 [compost metagenome]
MPSHERQPFILAGEQIGPGLLRLGQDIQIRVLPNNLGREIRIARMRGQEGLIKTTRQQGMLLQGLVLVNAREFHFTRHLRDAIQNIQSGLHGPTNK